MLDLQELLRRLREVKPYLHDRYFVRELAIFGSYARNEQHVASDVDILVDLERPLGLEFVDLALELEKILGFKVDLVSKNGIKPRYFSAIQKELHYV